MALYKSFTYLLTYLHISPASLKEWGMASFVLM